MPQLMNDIKTGIRGIRGAGDALRGGLLDATDDVCHRDSTDPKTREKITKNQAVSEKGRNDLRAADEMFARREWRKKGVAPPDSTAPVATIGNAPSTTALMHENAVPMGHEAGVRNATPMGHNASVGKSDRYTENLPQNQQRLGENPQQVDHVAEREHQRERVDGLNNPATRMSGSLHEGRSEVGMEKRAMEPPVEHSGTVAGLGSSLGLDHHSSVERPVESYQREEREMGSAPQATEPASAVPRTY